jgi:outer membrane protein TolC
MIMRISVLAVLAAVRLAVAQEPTMSLSLEDAVAAGLQQSAVMQASAAGMEAAAAKANEIDAARLPSIRMEAGYRRFSDVTPFEVRLPGSASSLVLFPNIPNTYAFRVALQQPLFTGFRLQSNARAAEMIAEAAKADYRNTRSGVILAVTTAYWTLYQTVQARRFVDENVTRLERYVADTQNLVQAGVATRNDLLRIEVQHSGARLARIDADHDVQVAGMSLNTLLGFPLTTGLGLSSIPPDSVAAGESLAPDTGTTGVRQDLEAMNLRVSAARENLTAARAGWWPQVSLSAGVSDNRPNQRYTPPRDEFKTNWDVGVGLTWDIWNWLTPAYQSDYAAAQVRQSESLYRQMQENITLEVARARLGVVHAAEKISVAREAVVQAEENVRSLTDKYRAGLATSSELLDAEVALLQSNTGLSGARVEYAVATARLKNALGTPSTSGPAHD